MRSVNGTSGKNTVTFKSAMDIYATLDSNQDLYCIDDGIYMFLYNAAGAIAYYYLGMKKLMELAAEAEANGEDYIAGLLGPGGYIIDTDNYEDDMDIEGDDDITAILEFLEDFVGKEFLYANTNDLV